MKQCQQEFLSNTVTLRKDTEKSTVDQGRSREIKADSHAAELTVAATRAYGQLACCEQEEDERH